MAQPERKGTTKKHELFVSEPMGEKHVTEIPGIGKVTAENMAEDGITQVGMETNQMQVETECLHFGRFWHL